MPSSDILQYSRQVPTIVDSYNNMTDALGRQSLNRAQIGQANAQTDYLKAETAQKNAASPDVFSLMKQNQNILDTYPQDSAEWQYANRLQNTLVNSGETGGMMGIKGSHGGNNALGGGASLGSNGEDALNFNPAGKSSRSPRGDQYILPTADGKYQVFTAPTTGTQTQIQNRMLAAAEIKAINPYINNGLKNFWSPEGRFELASANLQLRNQNLPPEQRQELENKITDYAVSRRLIIESATMKLRELGVAANGLGEHAIDNMVKQMYPGLPAEFFTAYVPNEIQIKANEKAQAAIDQAQLNAAELAAQNFGTTTNQNPAWNVPQQSPLWTDKQKQIREAMAAVSQQNNSSQSDWKDHVSQGLGKPTGNQQPGLGKPTSQPAQSKVSNSSNVVQIQAPDGKIYNVPKNRVQEVIKAGGKQIG